MTKSAKKSKKYWYTYAFFTRDGTPHAAHRLRNFTHWYGQLSMLVYNDLQLWEQSQPFTH